MFPNDNHANVYKLLQPPHLPDFPGAPSGLRQLQAVVDPGQGQLSWGNEKSATRICAKRKARAIPRFLRGWQPPQKKNAPMRRSPRRSLAGDGCSTSTSRMASVFVFLFFLGGGTKETQARKPKELLLPSTVQVSLGLMLEDVDLPRSQ